jgi:hypothetical protein
MRNLAVTLCLMLSVMLTPAAGFAGNPAHARGSVPGLRDHRGDQARTHHGHHGRFGHHRGHHHGHFVPWYPYGAFSYSDIPYSLPVSYSPPPEVSAPVVVYSSPTVYAPVISYPPPAPVATAAPAAPPMPTVVEYSTGRYELRGDGVTASYVWVWIPNPPDAPPPQASSESPARSASPRIAGPVYHWTEEDGTVVWTNRADKVPDRLRSGAVTPAAARQDPS